MKQLKEKLSKAVGYPTLYWLLFSVVAVIFTTLAFIYAHRLPSRLDEGSFLIKGYYYITGRYAPFQDYGPWTNNMPLAYYIPGLAQALFGPGLKTGRYFAIFITSVNLVGIWLLLNRMKGKWWALLGVLVIAINPAVIKIYVQALSQGVVACLLTWALVFLIGDERRLWQIALGAFLCTLTTLTRQNMIILLPFAVIYTFWLHGRKAGWLALAAAAIPFITVHVIFYPQIMTLWYSWLPGVIRKAFGIVVIAGGGQQIWSPETTMLTRISSFFTAFRYHFFVLLGVFLAAITLPVKTWWPDVRERKTVLLIVSLFIIFFGLHAWAALAKNYCVYCFPNYLAFFLPVGLLISVLAFSKLWRGFPPVTGVLVALFTLVITPGLFIGSLATVGRWVMELPFPRVKGGQLLAGNVPLWTLFSNKFDVIYDDLLPLIAPAVGLMAALVFILAVFAGCRLLKMNKRVNFGTALMVALMTAGVFFTPTYLLGNDLDENTCGGDVLAAYEQAGAHLAEVIPARATVFWSAGSVVTPLVYITGAELHPPQLNGIYSSRIGGDRDLLEKAGYYNEISRSAWKESDEFFILSFARMSGGWVDYLNPQDFVEYAHTVPLDPCDPNSMLRIYQRKNH